MLNRMFDFKISEDATKEFYENIKVILREGFLADHTYCRILEDKLKRFTRALNAESFQVVQVLYILLSAFSHTVKMS